MLTVDSLKQYLKICDNSQDRLLKLLLESAISTVESYIGRKIEKSDYNEVINGDAQREIFTKNYPINSITKISYNTGTHETPVWEDLDKVDYTYKSTTWNIYLKEHLIRGFQNYKIEYNAGYTEVPADIQICILKLASKYYNTSTSDGIKWETVNGDRIDFDASQIPNDVLVILSSYRDI